MFAQLPVAAVANSIKNNCAILVFIAGEKKHIAGKMDIPVFLYDTVNFA